MDENSHDTSHDDGYKKQNSYKGINPLVVRIAKNMVRKVIGKHGFTEADQPDLEQELVKAGLDVLDNCNHVMGNGGGLILFAMRSRLNSIVSKRYFGKRDWRKLQSLHEEITGNGEDLDDSLLIDYVADCGHMAPFDSEESNPLYQQIRCRDINAAIQYLPKDLQQLCEDFKTMTSDEIMKKRKLSPGQLSVRKAKIRYMFLAYLGKDEFGE